MATDRIMDGSINQLLIGIHEQLQARSGRTQTQLSGVNIFLFTNNYINNVQYETIQVIQK